MTGLGKIRVLSRTSQGKKRQCVGQLCRSRYVSNSAKERGIFGGPSWEALTESSAPVAMADESVLESTERAINLL